MPRIDRNKVADIANKASLFATRARRYYQIDGEPESDRDTAGQHDAIEAAWRLAKAVRPIRDADTEGRKRFPTVFREVQRIRAALRGIEEVREWPRLEMVLDRDGLDRAFRGEAANPLTLASIKDIERAAAVLAEEAAHWPDADEPPVYLGDGKVWTRGGPIVLEVVETMTLESLVDLQVATKFELIRHSGVEDAPRVLKRIARKHPSLGPHIVLPGKRGAGGYRTTIRRR